MFYRTKTAGLILICCFVFASVTVHADFGDSGWMIFKKVESAQFKGLAAAAPRHGDIIGTLYNPAALTTGKSREVHFISEVGEIEDKLGGGFYSHPLENDLGILTVGAMYYDAGATELNWIENTTLMTKEVSAQTDMLGIASFKFKTKGSRLIKGVSVKFAQSELAEMESAYAYAADLGMFYLPKRDMSLSISVQNIGDSTSFVNKKSDLPMMAYVGAGYTHRNKSKSMYVTAAIGGNHHIKDKKFIGELGLEVGTKLASVNVGYRSGVDDLNMHVGLRTEYKDWTVGYAFIPGDHIGNSHRISIGYKLK